MASVIVVGGGKVGSSVASLLLDAGHGVSIVERAEGGAASLQRRLVKAAIVLGSGTEAATLERAGVRGADVVAAVAGADETNLVVCSLARFEFGVPRTIARIVDPANAWIFEADMGVDVALNQADLLAHLVAEEMSLGEMTTLLKLRKGRYSLVEEKIDPEAPVVDKHYEEVEWPIQCRIVGVIRDGDLIDVTSDVVLRPHDEVLAVVHSDSMAEVARLLGAPAG